ncbi:MAG: tripartite tricarboxylate transporter permease [Candidatus Hydrothermales bacterium]
MNILLCLLVSLIGTIVGILFSWIPALHIYNILALVILIESEFYILPLNLLPYFFIGAIVGYAFTGIIPAVYFSTNDDSTLFYLLPAQKFLLYGRAHEAVLLSTIGSIGAAFIVLISTAFLPFILPPLRDLLTPHMAWIIASIGAFMILSEWPRTTDRPKTPLGRLKEAWGSLIIGILVFVLSGILGYIVLRGGLMSPETSFQNLMPLFLGLFAVPWLTMNIVSRPIIPIQDTENKVITNYPRILRGIFAGSLGGGIAAFFPVITGGIGAFLAGHATAQRGDDIFLIGQGANRFLYYVGGFLLFFVPYLHIKRGGAAWMLNIIYTPQTFSEYFLIIGNLLISSFIAFYFTIKISIIIAKNIHRIPYKNLSIIILIFVIILTFLMTGFEGLLILFVSSAVGLLPPLFGTRRLNCLGALILPLTIQMSSFAESFAKLMGF